MLTHKGNLAMTRLLTTLMFLGFCAIGQAQQQFSQLVGNVTVQPVAKSSTITVPYITWGGDTATFLANGGLKTENGSIYKTAGLQMQLVAGDDFVGQVKSYMTGKSPFLRGTFHMLGQASEVIAQDPRTKPVVILQLSWSAGDHIVARGEIKSLNGLKGKKIACQQGGPHVGLLFDSLTAAQLTNKDVTIVWTKDLTGPEGAAELFRKDKSIDAACVITPDMLGLTGGLDSAGSGAEGTVKDAHVINSTQQMSRSIADVYAVRRDWYDANKDWVKKFVAGYLKAASQVVTMRKQFEDSKKLSPEYRDLLAMSQKIFGAEVLPTLEVDAHGLLLDCNFISQAGQIEFFNDKRNLSGFDEKLKEALKLATEWGYATTRNGFEPAAFDYKEIAKLAGLEFKEPKLTDRFEGSPESTDAFLGENLDANTIVSFTINFEPNQKEFSADRYGAEFNRALKAAATFGNARVVIRGHSDPTKTLIDLVKTGIAKGLIKQSGTSGNFRYFYKGAPLDLTNVKEISALISSGAFAGGKDDPNVTMQAAMALSKQRADEVRDALSKYAVDLGVNVDLSQITPIGAGITEPIVAKPTTIDQAKENMRVEFRIVKVDAETIAPTDFNF
jgi:ABC-type nitrate/sulfonate/bicarbonate transport system substrate-binding protein